MQLDKFASVHHHAASGFAGLEDKVRELTCHLRPLRENAVDFTQHIQKEYNKMIDTSPTVNWWYKKATLSALELGQLINSPSIAFVEDAAPQPSFMGRRVNLRQFNPTVIDRDLVVDNAIDTHTLLNFLQEAQLHPETMQQSLAQLLHSRTAQRAHSTHSDPEGPSEQIE